jgi:hypothetical protein
MADPHLIAYILNPKALALHADDVPAVMILEGTRRCCMLALPRLSGL